MAGRGAQGKRDRAVLMTKVCTHGRDKAVAMRMLEESLSRLQTDHLDVWQIHEVIYENDPDLIFRPNGAAEALMRPRNKAKCGLSDSPGTRILPSICRCWRTIFLSIRCRCR